MFDAIVRNGILMTVAALIISVLGVLAAFRVPIQMIPDLEVRTISIETAWPGETPQDVEKDILIEQEEYLRTLPNLQRLESSASSGRAVIELDFPFGVDITQTLIRVNNALNQVPEHSGLLPAAYNGAGRLRAGKHGVAGAKRLIFVPISLECRPLAVDCRPQFLASPHCAGGCFIHKEQQCDTTKLCFWSTLTRASRCLR